MLVVVVVNVQSEEELEVVGRKAGDEPGGNGDSGALARLAFSGQEDRFLMVVEENTMKLKKVIGKGSMKLTLAQVKLKVLNAYEIQKSLFNYILKANQGLREENLDIRTKLTALEEEVKISKAMLMIFEKEKNAIEDEMYENFLPILNAKKQKIGQLVSPEEYKMETDVKSEEVSDNTDVDDE